MSREAENTIIQEEYEEHESSSDNPCRMTNRLSKLWGKKWNYSMQDSPEIPVVTAEATVSRETPSGYIPDHNDIAPVYLPAVTHDQPARSAVMIEHSGPNYLLVFCVVCCCFNWLFGCVAFVLSGTLIILDV